MVLSLELPNPPSWRSLKYSGRLGAGSMRRYKKQVASLVTFKPAFLYEARALMITIVFHVAPESLFYKHSRTLKTWDIDNRVKPLLDALAASFGFSDSKFSIVNASKRLSKRLIDGEFPENYVSVKISIDHQLELILDAS